ncbi:hypothetical protein HanPSC8_Chr17g0788981 [Helianthus annuus]|nr:hypothetical protein HanPSC8_Chr17g0788981 [Helianthus annuus]
MQTSNDSIIEVANDAHKNVSEIDTSIYQMIKGIAPRTFVIFWFWLPTFWYLGICHRRLLC